MALTAELLIPEVSNTVCFDLIYDPFFTGCAWSEKAAHSQE
jgi:hypothetical protein